MTPDEQLKLAREMLARPLPPGITMQTIKGRLRAYNAKKGRKKKLEIEQYLKEVFWPGEEKSRQTGPTRYRRKTNRKARPLSISADALCDMAAESDRKRELELQAEALQYKQEFEEINAARLRRGALPIPWHIYCRDRAIGIFAEKDLQK